MLRLSSKAIDMVRYILCFAVLLVAILQKGPAFSANLVSPANQTIESCRTISDAIQRLHCFEDVTSGPAQQPAPNPMASTGWRPVHTPSPKGGDTLSMTRTADTLRSDPDFAGLTIHCGQNGPEVLVIVIQPFPPQARPQITLGGPINQVRLEAKVLPAGAALLLPDDAITLAKGPWQSQIDLPVKIESGDARIQGVVPLDGLAAALQTLTASCPAQ